MQKIFLELDDTLIIKNECIIKMINEKYEDKYKFIITTINLNDDVDDNYIHIYYRNDNDYSYRHNYINKNIIIIDEWNQIDDILKFYDKYDYKTLNKRDMED